jgi:hypothetical protein
MSLLLPSYDLRTKDSKQTGTSTRATLRVVLRAFVVLHQWLNDFAILLFLFLLLFIIFFLIHRLT